MRFTKMHGIGNDFVHMDGRGVVADWPALARQICDRHFGVGSDGLILVEDAPGADAAMRMFNPDGSESEMCGNGIRTFAKYVLDAGLVRASESLRVKTGAGVLALQVHRRNGRVDAVTVDMGPPILDAADIPVDVARAPVSPVLSFPLAVAGEQIPVTCVSMGNPHAVTFVDDVDAYPLDRIGPLVEHDAFFPRRVNFEIAQVESRRRIKLRVWERGAGLTLACGTGACATVVAARLHGLVDDEVVVALPGGELTIAWSGTGAVHMRGPAATVYNGDWPLG